MASGSSHLEQADTGRETLRIGLSEKLDRGMAAPPSGTQITDPKAAHDLV